MSNSPSSSPVLTFRDPGFIFKGEAFCSALTRRLECEIAVRNAMQNAPIHIEGVYRIPIAPLLDQLRRLTGNEDEADRCMIFVRDNIGPNNCAEIGRVGDDDANYIIIYPRDQRPADFRKSKTNTLTVVDLVKVALYSLQNEVKPYNTINGVKVTRSNLSTARQIAEVIKNDLPNIKIMNFANSYTAKQLQDMINALNDIKVKKEREDAIIILKERGFSNDQINHLFKDKS